MHNGPPMLGWWERMMPFTSLMPFASHEYASRVTTATSTSFMSSSGKPVATILESCLFGGKALPNETCLRTILSELFAIWNLRK